MKLDFEKVAVSTAVSLLLIVATYAVMRMCQQMEFSNHIQQVIRNSNGNVEVSASYNNLDKSYPWDRDYEKMIVVIPKQNQP